MKDPFEKTKVVIRHLPPTLTQSDLFQHINERFSSRYNWFSFRPGKYSQKRQKYSRAYIHLNHPDDVFEFADFFDGHVFVNEKGIQHKAIVEYAPSQRLPKPVVKKDVREGTIFRDPDYLEFLKLIAKPTEHLPSAEIQLERKEAQQSGSTKETPVVTPLMEFIRHRRAVESGNLASSNLVKVSRRTRVASTGKSLSTNNKRRSEKKKYIQKDKKANRREKSTFIQLARRDHLSATASSKSISESEPVHSIEGTLSGIPLTDDSGKMTILLLKGKERGISHGSDTTSQQQSVLSAGSSPSSAASKQNPKREAGGKCNSILLDNEPRQSQSASVPNQKIQIVSGENGKRPPRPGNLRSVSNGLVSNHAVSSTTEVVVKREVDSRYVKKESQGSGGVGDKLEKRTRNKDRPDRGVWAPLRRSNVSHSSSKNSSFASQSTQSLSGSIEGSHHHFGRRGDSGPIVSEGKSSKRGAAGHGAHEPKVWVQKAPSGT